MGMVVRRLLRSRKNLMIPNTLIIMPLQSEVKIHVMRSDMYDDKEK